MWFTSRFRRLLDFGASLIAMGFLCTGSANVFAGDGSNESAPPPANAVPQKLIGWEGGSFAAIAIRFFE